MKDKTILVALKFFKGELNPFDGSALECALSLKPKQVIALTMAPQQVKGQLESISRLGVKCILISDPVFAGSDTVATSKVLARAVEKINPDIIFCGRQSVDGDTSQVPPMLAKRIGFDVKTKVIECVDGVCTLRNGEKVNLVDNTIYTFEKTYSLRFPSIFSKVGEIEFLTNLELNFDKNEVGILGSPTKVVKSYESSIGRRFCKFIQVEQLKGIIEDALNKGCVQNVIKQSEQKLNCVYYVGDIKSVALSIAEDAIELEVKGKTAEQIAADIKNSKIKTVLWQDDDYYKSFAPQVAVLLDAGMCADCISLRVENDTLVMTRPALGGTITADIVCTSDVTFATVRTIKKMKSEVIFSVGYGAVQYIDKIKELASVFNAEICASRRVVDEGKMPYTAQVGLTGKVVNPKVYVAFGVSGAVQHTCAINGSGTIIAVNVDKDARIYDYADYGIKGDIKDVKL